MDFRGRCILKNIKVTELPQKREQLRRQWESHFANHLSEKEKKAIFLYDNDGASGFLWHVFSYETKECLVGENAEEAFNSEMKSQCYVFYQHEEDAFILENASNLLAEDLSGEEDIYITDKGFNWTFVTTHETGLCGPYFGQKYGLPE